MPLNNPDYHYERAKALLLQNPTMGKAKLAAALYVKTPTSRRLLHRFRGETQGSSTDAGYCRVASIEVQNPGWSASKTAAASGLTINWFLSVNTLSAPSSSFRVFADDCQAALAAIKYIPGNHGSRLFSSNGDATVKLSHRMRIEIHERMDNKLMTLVRGGEIVGS